MIVDISDDKSIMNYWLTVLQEITRGNCKGLSCQLYQSIKEYCQKERHRQKGMVHTHLNEMQAIMTFYILKIHTFSNLSELYEISSL